MTGPPAGRISRFSGKQRTDTLRKSPIFQLLQTSDEKFLRTGDSLILNLSKNAKKRKSILTRMLTIY